MTKETRVLLDTPVLYWLAVGNSEQLSADIVETLERHAHRRPLLVSIISVWEIALLESIGLSVPIVVESCRLPGQFHADPADRFLVSTARAECATLVTRDAKIVEYGKVGHVRVMEV
jgi:PIN domain nuclease of toxin-antitoxin system